MNDTENIFGCFVSYPSLMYDATEQEKLNAQEQGDFFYIYIWGEQGVSNILKKLKHEDYGNDLKLILFQFYVNPIPYELEHLEPIERYRKKEKSIGIPIVVNDDNFFSKSEKERYHFLQQSIFEKMDLLAEVVRHKKLDTKMDLLKSDLKRILC